MHGFGATPSITILRRMSVIIALALFARPPAAREPLCAGLHSTGLVLHRAPRVCHNTWRQAARVPGRCGPRGSTPVCGSHFPGVLASRPGPVPLCVPRATRCSTPWHSPVGHPGWAGVVFGHQISTLPSFGSPFGVPHPGILSLHPSHCAPS